MMKSSEDNSTAKTNTPTRPRTGGPPRWLVVVLVLAIGVGVGIQWKASEQPLAVATPAAPILELRWRDTIPESHYTPDWGIFSHASMATDAATDRVWLLTSDRSAKPGVLLLSSSPDGGDSWYTPVDVGLQFPKLTELEGQLHRTSDGVLYITASGRAKPGGALTAAILRSTDDGAQWEMWQRLPASITSISPVASIRYAASDDALYVIGLQSSSAGGSELAGYRVGIGDGKITAHVLASFPARSQHLISSVLASSEGLFVVAMVRQRGSHFQPWITCLEPDGDVGTPMHLPLDKSLRPIDPTLVQTTPGEIFALVPAQTLPKSASKRLRIPLGNGYTWQPLPSRIDFAAAPTCLWQWDRVSSQWVPVGDVTRGPKSSWSFIGLGEGFAIQPDPLKDQGIPGFRFHAITTAPPGWANSALVRGPAATRAQLLDSALMKHGEALLLVHEHTHTNRDLLFLWRTTSLTPLLSATTAP